MAPPDTAPKSPSFSSNPQIDALIRKATEKGKDAKNTDTQLDQQDVGAALEKTNELMEAAIKLSTEDRKELQRELRDAAKKFEGNFYEEDPEDLEIVAKKIDDLPPPEQPKAAVPTTVPTAAPAAEPSFWDNFKPLIDTANVWIGHIMEFFKSGIKMVGPKILGFLGWQIPEWMQPDSASFLKIKEAVTAAKLTLVEGEGEERNKLAKEILDLYEQRGKPDESIPDFLRRAAENAGNVWKETKITMEQLLYGAKKLPSTVAATPAAAPPQAPPPTVIYVPTPAPPLTPPPQTPAAGLPAGPNPTPTPPNPPAATPKS